MSYETYSVADLIDEIAMGPFGSNIKVSCFVDSGVPVLNGSNLEGFSLSEKAFRYVTEEKADSLNKANAHRGDIVITHRGTLGQIVFIPQDSRYDRYVISQSQFRVRCNDKVLPEYLVYYFHTPIGQYKLLSNASQVGVPALARPSSTFQQIEVTLPELSIQKRVVEIITTIQRKIENNQELNDNLEQQAQALFKSWFVDFEPFSNQKPSDWSVSTLGNVSIMGAGGDKPQNISPIKSNLCQYPIYSNGLSEEGLYGFTDKPKIFKESVTVSARGTIGFVCLRHIPYVPIVRLVTLIPKTEIISAKYLYLWLKQLHITGTGTTQQQLTVPDFRKTEILVPSQEIVTLFTATVEPIFEKIWANQNENEKLSSLRDTLLPKLMSGEIDVSDIQL
jgi:type I restriction enzyme S subunit